MAILVPREGPLRKLAEAEGVAGAATAPLKVLLCPIAGFPARFPPWRAHRACAIHCRARYVATLRNDEVVVALLTWMVWPQDLLTNSALNAAVLKKLQATGRAGKLKVRAGHCGRERRRRARTVVSARVGAVVRTCRAGL